jgi:hypothetical protein
MRAYPRNFLAWFWSLLGLIALTGLVLLPGMLALRLEWDVPDRWLPPARVTWAAVHGLLAFLTLMLLGSILPLHVRHGLRQLKNRGTGIALLATLPVLILTGWGIYYFSNEDLARWTSVLHVLIALPISVLLGWHAWRAQRIHKESRARQIK